ncbi:hypothetical protein EUGRSUZ_D00757 [Eucalyptus grandis]|uniref:Uncharacterized protein n=2 Tax=Eucalyptus grandis TaxID=71139 RepID=A0ACC3L471_EUCGR|nr:hypothetical protein EUGRSUZ_D00757 [Eucalyptus grandis]
MGRAISQIEIVTLQFLHMLYVSKKPLHILYVSTKILEFNETPSSSSYILGSNAVEFIDIVQIPGMILEMHLRVVSKSLFVV